MEVVSSENGFGHHSLLFTLPSLMLHFCGRSEKARIPATIVHAVVSTEWKTCVV